jgi:hypothetical protein
LWLRRHGVLRQGKVHLQDVFKTGSTLFNLFSLFISLWLAWFLLIYYFFCLRDMHTLSSMWSARQEHSTMKRMVVPTAGAADRLDLPTVRASSLSDLLRR